MDKKILMVGFDPAATITTTVIVETALERGLIVVNNHEVKNQLRKQLLLFDCQSRRFQHARICKSES